MAEDTSLWGVVKRRLGAGPDSATPGEERALAAAMPTGHPPDNCPLCRAARAKATGQTTKLYQVAFQLGPLIVEQSVSASTGKRYFGVGLGLPEFGASTSVCEVRASGAQTEEDAVAGAGFGLEAGTPYAGPVASQDFSGMRCTGVGVGSGGIGPTVGYTMAVDPVAKLRRDREGWRCPTASPWAARRSEPRTDEAVSRTPSRPCR